MSKISEKWRQAAENLGETVPLDDVVVCDICNRDYTESDQCGGFIFGSNAYCPPCAERSLTNILRYGEVHYIRALCPAGVNFADFVRAYRGPNAGITIEKLED